MQQQQVFVLVRLWFMTLQVAMPRVLYPKRCFSDRVFTPIGLGKFRQIVE